MALEAPFSDDSGQKSEQSCCLRSLAPNSVPAGPPAESMLPPDSALAVLGSHGHLWWYSPLEWGRPTVHVQDSGVGQSHPTSHGGGVSFEPELQAGHLALCHFLLLGLFKPRHLWPISYALSNSCIVGPSTSELLSGAESSSIFHS